MKSTISLGSICRNAMLASALLASFNTFAEVDSNQHWRVHTNVTIDWDEQQGQALIADFDGDGMLDLFYHSNNGPRMYRNGGNGNFTGFANIGWVMYDYYRFAHNYAFDYNCDGHVDIFTAGFNHTDNLAPRVRLYVNGHNDQNAGSGYGWFGAADGSQIGIDLMPRALKGDNNDVATLNQATAAIGDYDHDGYPDILVQGRDPQTGESSVRLYHNEAGNGFTEAKIFTTLNSRPSPLTGDIAMVDLNNDGWLDIVINGWSSRGGHVYLNDEGYAFYEVADPWGSFNIPRESGMAFNDFNGDGYLDFIGVGYGDAIRNGGGGWSAVIYTNTAGSHANKEVIYLDGREIHDDIKVEDWNDYRVVVRDFDGDGYLDILKEDSQRFTYYGKSDNTYEEGSRMYSRGQGINRSIYAFGDVTGNGTTDCFALDYQWNYTTGNWKFVAEVYENIRGGHKTLTGPRAPTKVSYETDGDDIIVRWTDSLNNKKLGYNVVVETTDGKVFATLPVNLENNKPMVGEGRHTLVRPGVGKLGYTLRGIKNIKRVGVQALSIYNETYTSIVWAK